MDRTDSRPDRERVTPTTASGRPACLFVAPDGNDAWSGALPAPAPDGKDGPLAGVARARDLLRERRRAHGAPFTSTVTLRGGTYGLDEPLVFTPEDSGSAGAPIVYRAYSGETPALSGGRRITGWRQDSVSGQACWSVILPEVKSGLWNFTQLFVNGERRQRPRLPKTGFFHFADRRPTDFPDGLVRYGNGPTHAYYRPGDLRLFRNVTDVKLLTYNAWYETHHRLKSVDEREQRVDFQSRGFSGGYTGEGSRYVVDNVFEALDTPGDWYLDRPTGTLYYLPLPHETLDTTEIVAPRLTDLVRFAGTESAPVHHIRFERLAFEHAEWDYAPDFAGSLQAADRVPGAIQFDWAEHCTLFDCRVAHVAQYAVDIRRGSHANSVVACVLEDLGAGGVRVGNEGLPGVDGVYDAEIVAAKPMAATIADCTIRDGGKLFPSAVGVWIGNAGWNSVLHNHIFNLSYTGISCGWIWGYAPSRTVGNRIEGNHVHHIAWDRLLHDLGGIYTLGRQPGGRIRNNTVHHVGGNGIYLDEGSSEFLVERNLVHDVDCVGFTLHYGQDNEVRHNVFALSGIAHLTPAAMETHRSMVYHHNAVVWINGSVLGANPWGSHTHWWPQYNLCHDLLLWDAHGGPSRLPNDATLVDWQAQGQFERTVVADPLFADPASGDFSFSADSPLAKLGSAPIDVAGTGPRFTERRPATFDDWLVAFAIPPEPMATSHLDTPEPGLVRLTIRNFGSIPVLGQGTLSVAPAGALDWQGQAGIQDLRAEPGREFVRVWRFTTNSSAPRRVTVTAELKGAGLLATALHLLVRSEDWRLPQLPALAGPEAVGSALANQDPLLLRHPLFGIQAGEVRAAVAGADLALDVRVQDRHIHLGQLAWQGSCIEVFGAPVGVKGISPTQPAPGIGQVMLVPGAGATPARALYAKDGEHPAPDIRLSYEPGAKGYRLRALIPLSRFGLTPEADTFTFQIVVTTTPARDGHPVRVPLFYYDAGAFATAMHHGLVMKNNGLKARRTSTTASPSSGRFEVGDAGGDRDAG